MTGVLYCTQQYDIEAFQRHKARARAPFLMKQVNGFILLQLITLSFNRQIHHGCGCSAAGSALEPTNKLRKAMGRVTTAATAARDSGAKL